MSVGTIYLTAGLLTTGCFLLFAIVPLPRAYYPELALGRPQEIIHQNRRVRSPDSNQTGGKVSRVRLRRCRGLTITEGSAHK